MKNNYYKVNNNNRNNINIVISHVKIAISHVKIAINHVKNKNVIYLINLAVFNNLIENFKIYYKQF